MAQMARMESWQRHGKEYARFLDVGLRLKGPSFTHISQHSFYYMLLLPCHKAPELSESDVEHIHSKCSQISLIMRVILLVKVFLCLQDFLRLCGMQY